MRKVCLLIVSVLLSACTFTRSTPSSLPPSTASSTPGNQPCAFLWATQPLPELSSRVQAALQAAGLTNTRATAEAYGEDCQAGPAHEIISFSPMETDFHVTATVKGLSDQEQLGDQLEKILKVLDGFPPGSTPGPLPGYVGVSFQAGGQEVRLWFPVSDGVAARAQGLHGKALLEKLQR